MNFRNKSWYAALMICAILPLGACDPSRMNNSKQTRKAGASSKKICFFDAGGSFGKSGVRARQFIGTGPKMRVVQWKTADYLDETQPIPIVKSQPKPSIELQLSWRISLVNGVLESSFESLDANAINLSQQDLVRAKNWRIEILDNDSVEVSAAAPSHGIIRDNFSTEDRGKPIPTAIGEALGGINGGGFLIGLFDSAGNLILEREIKPMRGYEFKDKVKLAIEGLDEALKDEKNCARLATKLRQRTEPE